MDVRERYLTGAITDDLSEKMVFLGGARQVGKTTLARQLVAPRYQSSYYSWDRVRERRAALKGEWPPDSELILLDEFHKYPKWKTWIKGEYDALHHRYKFLLTGSARLNIYRRGGDSLQGRYHYYTLHPFSYAELSGYSGRIEPGEELIFQNQTSSSAFDVIMEFGGFPEPLLRQDKRFLRRWHNERVERFFREDIRELTMIRDFGSLTLLADLLPERASSILSINSLAEDLQVNYRTAAHWLDIFEQFYYCFRLPPYQSRKIVSVRKEKKLYLWDWSHIEHDGPKLENLVGLHLLKFCDCLYERDGWKVSLSYLRDTKGRETDFLVTFNNRPWFAVEVKSRERGLSKNLLYFRENMGIPWCYQVVNDRGRDYVKGGVRVMPVHKFLSARV